jgi:hypothetical protein
VPDVTCTVQASEDDWTVYVTGDPPSETTFDDEGEIVGSHSRVLSPQTFSTGYATVDTSAIPAEAIVISAELFWITHSYTTTPRYTGSRSVGVSGYGAFDTRTSRPVSMTSESAEMPSANLSQLTLNGETTFAFTVGDPGSGKFHKWQIVAYDTDPDDAPYLEVTYTLGGRRYRVVCL